VRLSHSNDYNAQFGKVAEKHYLDRILKNFIKRFVKTSASSQIHRNAISSYSKLGSFHIFDS